MAKQVKELKYRQFEQILDDHGVEYRWQGDNLIIHAEFGKYECDQAIHKDEIAGSLRIDQKSLAEWKLENILRNFIKQIYTRNLINKMATEQDNVREMAQTDD